MLNLLGIALFNSALGVMNFSKNHKQEQMQLEVLKKLNYLVSREQKKEDNGTKQQHT